MAPSSQELEPPANPGRFRLAQYQSVSQGDEWGILHDGGVKNTYATKEAAFEAAVAAASLAIREGHEVHVSVPDRSSGNQTALGAKD
jgi:hypothetical protein